MNDIFASLHGEHEAIRDTLCHLEALVRRGETFELGRRFAHFHDAFRLAGVDGALAASVFHKGIIKIPALKAQLIADGISIRP